jgi:hypothetical protein
MAWVITGDAISRPDEGEKSRVDYGEEHSRIPLLAHVVFGAESTLLPKHPEGNRVPFRLKDDDGEIYYTGVLDDDDDCANQSAALAWGEADAGCTTIEVLRGNDWVLEIG